MSDPTMITAKPHPSLEAAVRYATALEAFNAHALRLKQTLKMALPTLTPKEWEEISEALIDYRYAHRSPNLDTISQKRNAVFTFAINHGLATDPTSTFYDMMYHFSFNAGVLARAEGEALAERNPFSA